MPKNSKPRKKYSTRPTSKLLTAGLVNEMIANAYFFRMAAEAGYFSLDGWKGMAKILMTVSFATDNLDATTNPDKAVVDSAVCALVTISDREVESGNWTINFVELNQVCRGIESADRLIRKLNHEILSIGYVAFRQLVGMVK